MSRGRVRAALLAGLLSWALAAPGALAHAVPPAAPTPTDSGNSPAAPDPHPPRGGLGPDGTAVGGTRLLSRGDVLPAHAPALPADLTAQSWMLTDLDTGEIIAARDPHGRYQPASVQKLLTAVTLLPHLTGTTTVTVSRASADTEGSHAGLVAGGRYTVDQLFQGLLLVSGNDCAEALAAAAGGRTATVAMMNRTALALGAYDTLVQTPSGLDGWQQLTSAYDMTLVLRAALRQPRFVDYDNEARIVYPAQQGVGAVVLDNQNEQFLSTRGALVAKTGYTDAAQHTFVGAIQRGGHRYGVVLMRAQRYPDDQWVQASRLVAWAQSLHPGTEPVGGLITPALPLPKVTSSSAAAPRFSQPRATHAARDDDGLPTALVLLLIVVCGSVATGCTVHLVRGRRT